MAPGTQAVATAHAATGSGDRQVVAVSAWSWPNTVFIITYDERGGFFDQRPAAALGRGPHGYPPDASGNVLISVRVPVVVASPWTRVGGAPRIHSALYDHTSILKLIEWRWNLPNLTPRDAPSSNLINLAEALDFAHPNPVVPPLPLPLLITPVFNTCLLAPVQDPWDRLLSSPLLANWPLYPAAVTVLRLRRRCLRHPQTHPAVMRSTPMFSPALESLDEWASVVQ